MSPDAFNQRRHGFKGIGSSRRLVPKAYSAWCQEEAIRHQTLLIKEDSTSNILAYFAVWYQQA